MNKKEKQLVLENICSRLPHGLCLRIYNHWTDDFEDKTLSVDNIGEILNHFPIEDIKPYLRPIESITKEEEKELDSYVAASMFASQNKNPFVQLAAEALLADFFNKHHIDYHNLIPAGLAIKAKEGMYKIK